ncbi:MAG: hypothetical protein V1872_01435 [bacterium]
MDRKKGLCLLLLSFFVVCTGLVFSGCDNNSGSPSRTSGTTTGYEVPTKVSAVPTNENASAYTVASSNFSIKSLLTSLAATDPETDYSQAGTNKYVEEHTLEQFDIIEQVLGALDQTHYADADNINAGPYKSMVAWSEEQNGIDIKQLQPWIVDSQEVTENGQTILRIRAWIEEQDESETNIVKAEFKIYTPATKRTDGSYENYGVWTMNVKFDETGTDDYFAASASVNANEKSVIKLHNKFTESLQGGAPFPFEMKAVMYISDTEGYGKVSYPSWEDLFGPDADPNATSVPIVEAKYAYNTNYLAVKKGDDATQYRDRINVVEMTHRYGVYNKDTGQDVMKIKSFGFPIRYIENGLSKHAFYGAWQGRHQFWGPGGNATLTEGTEVTQDDIPSDQPAQTYTVGPTFSGTLVKRILVDASINDIKDVPVEIWINQEYNLIYDTVETKWEYCTQMDWTANPPGCLDTLTDFDATIGLTSLIVGANDTRKNVNIGRWNGEKNQEYVYEVESSANDNQAGFYEATRGNNGRLTVDTPRVILDPDNNDEERNLFVGINGSIYVVYTDSGWKEKEVTGFNTMNWTPEFNESGDKDYTLPNNKELYINMQGVNYVVTKSDDITTAKMEIQTVANPNTASTIVPAGTIFYDQWDDTDIPHNSTYEFNTSTLMLIYKTIGDNDKDVQGEDSATIGSVVQTNLWGLKATINSETVYFNWEYAGENENWGKVNYLKNADETYKLLDDPIRFEPITATNGAGDNKTLVLQYDGWMMGLPQMHEELGKSGWVMTTTIANKIINLAAGTEVIDAVTGTYYLLKPLKTSQFLTQVTDTTDKTLPEITQAESADLTTVPDFVEHGMGTMPTTTTIKYSEGNLIE